MELYGPYGIPVASKAEKESFDRANTKAMIFTRMLKDSEKVVFFGGAGVSTESGIPDFRSATGVYSQKYGNRSPEQIVSRSFFDSFPREFYSFYREKMLFLDAKPNAAHLKLAELEKAGKDITIVTQNIDGLHQKAGSSKVIELHGSVMRNRCMKCGQEYNVNFVANDRNPVPECSLCGGKIKPDVVLYEESLDEKNIEAAVTAISECDMLIVAGTSLVVYPAAGFIRYFRGAHSVIINLSQSGHDQFMDLAVHEKVGEFLSQIDVSECVGKKKKSAE